MKNIYLVFTFLYIASLANAESFPDGKAISILPHLKFVSNTYLGESQESDVNVTDTEKLGAGYVFGLIRGVNLCIKSLQVTGGLEEDFDIYLGPPGAQALIAYNYFKENPEKLSETDGTLMLEAFMNAIRKKNKR
jgi:hypothetical protein